MTTRSHHRPRWNPALLLFLLLLPHNSDAFCGFYVAKADASLYNSASQVVMVRHDDKTVISMMNDYRGPLSDFALVVPVPAVLKKGQVHVGERKLFERIDAFSAPRLVEYYDSNPCEVNRYAEDLAAAQPRTQKAAGPAAAPQSLGVTVEAQYTVGEYDIVILSAKESHGLETWLQQNGYNIPDNAHQALQPYINQNMKFFVAKVNLKKQAQTGLTYLRPLQFAFRTDRFMLPIRLGMINADGPQDLLLYVLTKTGRVETTNYRTTKLPSGMDLPVFVKEDFADFYKAMFNEQVKRERMRAVFTEYFWNMGWCDPCAADPLSPEELRKLGVFWLDVPDTNSRYGRRAPVTGGAIPVMVTRLHIRYAQKTFPEDLFFQETNDTQNFQARYVLRHPWSGSPSECSAAREYFSTLRERQESEQQTLASLTGWSIDTIRSRSGATVAPDAPDDDSWWKDLWK
ncbi:MAG: DUF2330 domain-containing protein [Bdellovibrionales bacterium]|nr:DUF2330 domain-containing protein [Bdellovibrionales bacterium]